MDIDQKSLNKAYIVILIVVIIFIVMFTKYSDVVFKPEGYLSIKSKIANEFKTIIKDFSCLETKTIPNALVKTNKFTMSITLDVVDYNDAPNWAKILNGGTANSGKRTPGIWINQGFLHIRATTNMDYNEGEGCWKIEPVLEKGTHYHLIIVYDVQKMYIYIDGVLVKVCTTKGIIEPHTDLHLGGGANVNISVSYLPRVLSTKDINENWLAIKYASEL